MEAIRSRCHVFYAKHPQHRFACSSVRIACLFLVGSTLSACGGGSQPIESIDVQATVTVADTVRESPAAKLPEQVTEALPELATESMPTITATPALTTTPTTEETATIEETAEVNEPTTATEIIAPTETPTATESPSSAATEEVVAIPGTPNLEPPQAEDLADTSDGSLKQTGN